MPLNRALQKAAELENERLKLLKGQSEEIKKRGDAGEIEERFGALATNRDALQKRLNEARNTLLDIEREPPGARRRPVGQIPLAGPFLEAQANIAGAGERAGRVKDQQELVSTLEGQLGAVVEQIKALGVDPNRQKPVVDAINRQTEELKRLNGMR